MLERIPEARIGTLRETDISVEYLSEECNTEFGYNILNCYKVKEILKMPFFLIILFICNFVPRLFFTYTKY